MSPWRLLLTRPEEDCAALAQTLAEAGIASASLPLLAIEALEQGPAQRLGLQALGQARAIIVVSKPAARLLLDALDRAAIAPPPAGWFTVGRPRRGSCRRADYW